MAEAARAHPGGAPRAPKVWWVKERPGDLERGLETPRGTIPSRHFSLSQSSSTSRFTAAARPGFELQPVG
jgi:hypothetical protein